MTEPQEAGRPWLDMSRYPDTDPDTVLSPADQGLLTSALAVDDAALPDSVWEHMLAVVTGDTGDTGDDADGTDDADGIDGADSDDVGWTVDDPGVDDQGLEGLEVTEVHEPAHDTFDGDGTV